MQGHVFLGKGEWDEAAFHGIVGDVDTMQGYKPCNALPLQGVSGNPGSTLEMVLSTDKK